MILLLKTFTWIICLNHREDINKLMLYNTIVAQWSATIMQATEESRSLSDIKFVKPRPKIHCEHSKLPIWIDNWYCECQTRNPKQRETTAEKRLQQNEQNKITKQLIKWDEDHHKNQKKITLSTINRKEEKSVDGTRLNRD